MLYSLLSKLIFSKQFKKRKAFLIYTKTLTQKRKTTF